MSARLALALMIAAAAAAGCTCEAPVPGETSVVAPASGAADPPLRLARATRADLPLVTHEALVVAVRAGSFEVDPTALVAGPAAEQRLESAGLTAEVTRVAAPEGDTLERPALTEALRRAVEIQRASAPDDREPIAYALRVSADARWGRVLSAMYAAGQAGLSVPFFVLRSAGGTEVMLVLPLPRVAAAPDPETARAIDALLRGPEEHPEVVSIPPRAGAPEPALAVHVAADGATRLRLGEHALGRACARADSPEDAIALPARDGAPDALALDRCLDAGDVHSPTTTLDADPSLPFASVAPLLETLRARGDVAIAVTARDR